MTFDLEMLKSFSFGEIEQTYAARDSVLYALGIGLGTDPGNENHLKFLFEELEGFSALPSMAVVLASPGFWVRAPELGIDWKKVLHGEQGLELHKPMPPEGTVIGTGRIVDVVDKGAGKGALIYVERTLRDKRNGDKLATLTSTVFARGNGGFGGDASSRAPLPSMPSRAPDEVCDLPTSARAALIYRLSGDTNPLHVSPEVAQSAGFDAPILHGLCIYGVAGHAILQMMCGYDAARLRSLSVRFSSPAYPGETIRTEMWREGTRILFRSVAVERDVTVLNNGVAHVE